MDYRSFDPLSSNEISLQDIPEIIKGVAEKDLLTIPVLEVLVDNLSKSLKRQLNEVTFDYLEAADFQTANYCLSNWNICKKLQQSDEQRFLELLSKLLQQGCLIIHFDFLTCKIKNELLKRATKGLYSNYVSTSLVEALYCSYLSHRPPRDSKLVSPSLIEAYKTLAPEDQELVKKLLGYEVSRRLSFFHSAADDGNYYHHYTLYSELKRVVAKDFIDLISESIGIIETEFSLKMRYLYPLLLHNVSKKLGNSSPLGFILILDYKTKPLITPISTHKVKDEIIRTLLGLSSEGYIPDADPDDIIPKSDKESRIYQKTETDDESIRRVITIRDYLGAFFYEQGKRPHIILRVARIVECAKRLDVPVHELWRVVLIHEFAHLIHLSEEDSDGLLSTECDNKFAELTAQLITWNVVKNSDLQQTFEKLSINQSPVYRTWESIKDTSLEDFRGFLSLLRVQNIRSEYETAKRKYPLLPVV